MNFSTEGADPGTKASPSARHITDRELVDSEGDVWLTDHARLVIYQFLALATSKPHSESWSRLLEPNYLELVQAAVEIIRQNPKARVDRLAPGELPLQMLDLSSIKLFLDRPQSAEGCSTKITKAFCDEYDGVFGLLLSKECPQYETQYCPQTFSVFRSQQLGDIAGYYRAFGLEPSSKLPERHDHISLELEFMAWLNTKTLHAMGEGEHDNESLCRDAQVNFLDQHLAWWVTAFALALRKKADGITDERELSSPPKSFQGAVGSFLAAFIAAERGFLGIAAPTNLVAAITTPTETRESSMFAKESPGCNTKNCDSCQAMSDKSADTSIANTTMRND